MRIFNRAVNRWLLPHPLERASFHFINQTIPRSARHRLFLATVAGAATAVVLPEVVRFSAGAEGYRPRFTPQGFVIVPLVVSFFLVTGLRRRSTCRRSYARTGCSVWPKAKRRCGTYGRRVSGWC